MGEQYGYYDGFQEDGIFWYTGEGQVGDMKLIRGNRAIRDARSEGKSIHLFEYVRRAHVRYIGACTCVGYHYQITRDRNGEPRRAIVFELAIEGLGSEGAGNESSLVSEVTAGRLWTAPLAELRAAALSETPKQATVSERRVNARARSEAVRIYVLRRADGICEACDEPAPFVAKDGRPYLEPHHIDRLVDGGPDHPARVAAVCPNCHKRVHSGNDGDQYNQMIREYILAKEQSI
jgi:5-methylcytosine-specific restriction protein A